MEKTGLRKGSIVYHLILNNCLQKSKLPFRRFKTPFTINRFIKEKLEIVALLCEAKTAKELEKYWLELHFVKENFYFIKGRCVIIKI